MIFGTWRVSALPEGSVTAASLTCPLVLSLLLWFCESKIFFARTTPHGRRAVLFAVELADVHVGAKEYTSHVTTTAKTVNLG